MALSPDGSTLVYSTDPRAGLRARRIDQLESRELESAPGFAPFFSPDGRWIGFNRAGELMKVPVEGGTPLRLGATAVFQGGADWGADGFVVYAAVTPQGAHGLYRVPASGGTPQLIAALDGAEDAHWLTPQSIANGRVILCTLSRTVRTESRFQVVAVTVATGERRVLVDEAKHGLYLGDGVLVYLRKSDLFATRLDIDRMEVDGPHVPVWDNVYEREHVRSWAFANGTLVYWPTLRVGRRLVWVDRTGRQEPLALPPAMYQGPRLSPDGKSIAFSITESAQYGDLWKHDLSSGTSVRLTTDGTSGTPLWTPDGTGIVYSSLSSTGRELMQLKLGGAAEPALRIASGLLPGAAKEPAGWADNGRTLLVKQAGLASQPQVWAVALDFSREPQPALPRDATRGNRARVSPDGRWIAYEGGGDQMDVYVARRHGEPPYWRVSTGGGMLPVWSKDGSELFFRSGDRMMAVPVTPGETFTAGAPHALFQGRYFEAEPGAPNYDVAGDQRFLMVLPGDTEGPDRLNVVQGWKAHVLRRLRDSR